MRVFDVYTRFGHLFHKDAFVVTRYSSIRDNENTLVSSKVTNLGYSNIYQVLLWCSIYRKDLLRKLL